MLRFCRLLLVALAAVLMAPSLAWSGSYTTVLSGGSVTRTQYSSTYVTPYTINSGSYGGYSYLPGSVSCSGVITVTCTWVPSSPGEPPPASVIVYEECNAQAVVVSGDGGVAADDAINTSANTGYLPYAYNSDSKRYRAISNPGLSFQYTLNPYAGGHGSVIGVGTYQASLWYTTSVYPVAINTSGTIMDSSGNFNILVGQGCTSSLPGIPSTCTVSNYNWSISGTTFQSWSPTTPAIGANPANSQASYYVGGPGPLTNSTAHWYWNDPGPGSTNETVNCTTTITPPAGQGAAFNISSTKPVKVYTPTWSATGIGGYMKVSTGSPGSPSAYTLWAGPSAGQVGGMNWQASFTNPVPYVGGIVQIVQLVTPQLSYTLSGVLHPDPENGLYGLDTAYPYPGPTPGTNPYNTNDNPSCSLNDNTSSISMTHQFDDYLMYQPPGGDKQFVPLATFGWSTNGSATIPTTNHWSDYVAQHGSNAAGTVSPSTSTPFMAGNTFPKWTRINVFPSF